ncbi:MAG: 1 4-dihydroxy-2-naphthoate octaprenyltransferase [Anaerolineaceae bacterium]|nr:MAG: 1 4-dihydroxy-2-naphthoate octaprenyltransferase [Anaerolineaceae bacterium]
MNFAMWKKALTVIPEVSKEEWDKLDIISKWLISTRAAVLVMTFLSAVLAGLFALHDRQPVNLLAWLVLTLGLVLAHATNNIFNDYTDYVRGVDKDNYFRTQYGPQPVADGLLTKRQHLTYFAITGLLALACGLFLILTNDGSPVIWLLLGLGAVFVLFYTWPMKGFAMGELAVLIVWGPLMIGGGYYVLTGGWNWNVVWASLPYVLGVTTVIFGKHIDKREIDKAKKIYTLPVVIGEKAARYAVLAMMVLPYLIAVGLIAIRYFTPVMLVVFVAVPTFLKMYPQFLKPRPETRPEGFPDGQGGWPLYFAPQSFVNNRAFGMWFMLGLIADVVLRLALPTFWIIK